MTPRQGRPGRNHAFTPLRRIRRFASRVPIEISVALFALVVGAAPLHGQPVNATAPLESFIQDVARLWSAGDVSAIVDLLPRDGKVLLDTGSGSEAVEGRHASAALRALFNERNTTSARAVQITVSGSDPVRGFGELSWTFRDRGAPGDQSRSVYVAALWQDQTWRISELRLMP